jgi:transposase-like protein
MFSQPGSHRQRTSNPIEAAVMKQIRRRTRAGGIFPNEASCLRLVAVALVEIDGQWQTSRLPYLSPENDTASENDRISIPNVT